MNLLLEMLSGFTKSSIDSKSFEIYIFLGHEFYKFIDGERILFGSYQSEHDFSLIIINIITIGLYYIFHLLNP